MKKLNKLFGLMLIAGCSMSLASNVNAETTACEANDVASFQNCAENDTTHHVILVKGTYTLNQSVTVNGKRIALDTAANFTIGSGVTLTLNNFVPESNEGSELSVNANIWIPSNAEMVVQGTLNVTGDAEHNQKAIGIDGNNSDGKLTVNGGTVEVTGYEQGIRIGTLSVTNGYVFANKNKGNGINTTTLKVNNSVVSAEDNFSNGITAVSVTAENNSSISATNNGRSGLTFDGSTIKNSNVVATGNNTKPDEQGTAGAGTDLKLGGDMTVEGESTVVADEVQSKSSASSAKIEVKDDKAEVNISDSEVTVTGAKKGIIRKNNNIDIYTIEGDTITVDMSMADTNGGIRVNNHTDKDIKIVTAHSKTPMILEATEDKDATSAYYFVTLSAEGQKDKVVLFANQTLGDLSEEGKALLEKILGREGQHINNIYMGSLVVPENYKFIGKSATQTEDYELTASYYIILKFGDVEIYANPGTKLSNLGEKDKATLEKIKNATGRKFMYFAVGGKAISETDTEFDKDTEFLVLYEGDAAPVVPDVEPEPGEPSKPDDGGNPSDPERDPEAGEKDPSEELPNNQPTGDNVMGSVAMGIAGLVGIVGSALVFDKKTNYNN